MHLENTDVDGDSEKIMASGCKTISLQTSHAAVKRSVSILRFYIATVGRVLLSSKDVRRHTCNPRHLHDATSCRTHSFSFVRGIGLYGVRVV